MASAMVSTLPSDASRLSTVPDAAAAPGPTEGTSADSVIDALEWRALQWRDGCVYEGLEAFGSCQSHGVVTHPNGDRYEGQLRGSRMHGHGMYRWSNGTIYRGEWALGGMHGCGVRIWKDGDGQVQAQAGKFFEDDFVGCVLTCSTDSAHEAAVEADVAAHRARSFQAEVAREARQRNLLAGARTSGAASTSAGVNAPHQGWGNAQQPQVKGLPSSASAAASRQWHGFGAGLGAMAARMWRAQGGWASGVPGAGREQAQPAHSNSGGSLPTTGAGTAAAAGAALAGVGRAGVLSATAQRAAEAAMLRVMEATQQQLQQEPRLQAAVARNSSGRPGSGWAVLR